MASSQCAEGEVAVTFQRTTKTYFNEESLNIYAGTTATGTPVYTETTNTYSTVGLQPATTHCLAVGSYVVQMSDSFGDGWTTGSILTISANSEVAAVIQWTCGGSYSNRV